MLRSSERVHHAPDGSRDATHAFFAALLARHEAGFGYVWKRADFPWMGIWEENYSRTDAALERAARSLAAWSSASRRWPNRAAR